MVPSKIFPSNTYTLHHSAVNNTIQLMKSAALSVAPIHSLSVLKHHFSECPFSLENAIMVPVTLYSQLFRPQSFPAFKCRRTDETWTKTSFRDQPTQVTIQHQDVKLSPSACAYILRYKQAPNGAHLIAKEETPLSMHTNEYTLWNNSIMFVNSTHTVTNYHLYFINITIDLQTGFIASNSTFNLDKCLFNKNHCHDGSEVIIWNVPNTMTCQTLTYF